MSFDPESLVIICSLTVLMALSIYIPMSVGDLFMVPIGTMAIGAYAFGYATTHGWPQAAGLAAATAGATLVAAVSGWLVLRLQGFSTALATLAIALIIQVFFINFQATGGVAGMAQVPSLVSAPLAGGVSLLALVLLAVGEQTRFGRTSRAILQDPLAAEAVGVDVRLFRLWLFAASGAVSGLAGGLTAGFLTFIDPSQFGFGQLTAFVLAAMLGGTTTVVGPVVGGTLATLLPEVLRFLADYRLLAYSALVLVVILVRREGLITHREVEWALSRLRGGPRVRAGEAYQVSAGSTLEVRHASKAFGGQVVLADVSISAQPGSVLVIIGPNGAGKTTLLNTITAATRLDGGELLVQGQRLRSRLPHQTVRQGLARTFQNLRLFGDLTVAENVSLRDPSAVGPLLEFVGLLGLERSKARTLPYGQQRRLEIARALATKPRILLLDEPTAGMSAGEAEEIASLIRSLKQRGLTIVLIDHNLRFVMSVADSVVVMDAGQKIAEGAPAEVQSDPRVIEAYLGTRARVGDTASVLGPIAREPS